MGMTTFVIAVTPYLAAAAAEAEAAAEDVADEDKPLLDTLDIAVLTLVLCSLIYIGVTRYLEASDAPKRGSYAGSRASRSSVSSSLMSPTHNASAFVDDDDFVEKMGKSEKKLVVFFGSQTGTAEEYASRLVAEARSYGLRAMAADVQDYDMKRLTELHESIPDAVALFCMATYGEGDPTDNAQEFWDLLKGAEDGGDEMPLNDLRYAVFGLGNKQYEHFNSVGKYVDTMLKGFGGNQIVPVGLGDDDVNMEEDFAVWREGLWAKICTIFDIDPDAVSMESQRQYELKTIEGKPCRMFKGEPAIAGSFEKQKRPFTIKNPYLSTIDTKRELYTGTRRSCLHIELNTKGSGIRYTAGDHVAIYPRNSPELVEKLGQRLGIDLDEIMTMTAIDDDVKKRHPFPCPCTYRTALLYYINITGVPKMHVVRELSKHTADPGAQEHLTYVTSKEGKKEYGNWALRDHRTLMQILNEIPSLSPPIDVLLELLPRLQPRYYSISSSSKAFPDQIHVTAAVVDYETPLGVPTRGVCTGWFDELQPGETLPIFVRTSTFRLPVKASTPIIMIGPGTGLAPFRGFVQDRAATKKRGKLVGDTVLFFGAQKRAENFLYEDELLAADDANDITHLHLAFSRDQRQKCYVQHKLEEAGEHVYELIKDKSAHIYVCGDAKNMAHDVNGTFAKLAMKYGGQTEQQAVAWLKDLRRRKRYCEDVWS